MQGQLSEHPLAELIHEAKACGLSGVVRVEREPVRAAVYLRAGRVALASVNLRSARLGELLRRWNLFDADGWRRVERLLALPAANTDAGLAALLVRDGLLTPERRAELLARQTTEILRPLLLWREGTWECEPRVRLAEENGVVIDEPPLLIEAARRAPEEFVRARFADPTETVRPAAPRAAETIGAPEVELQPAEAFLLSRIDAPITIGELSQVGALPEAQMHAALYALVLANLAERDRPPRAFTPEAAARRRDAGVARSDRKNVPAPDVAAPSAPAESDAERMRALFARAEATDHYAMLGVARNAAPDRIKSAYYAFAKRFHPDVFDRDATSPELRARIEAAFARVATAYDTLKNPEARSKYDLRFAPDADAPHAAPNENAFKDAPAPPAVQSPAAHVDPTLPAAARADVSFREGLRAESEKSFALALNRFGEAARLAPQQARYRAHYGRALARDPDKRRQAEAELLAAVKLDAADAEVRVMLAEFYRDTGLRLRAIGELERLLAARPNEKSAQKLLDELRRGA